MRLDLVVGPNGAGKSTFVILTLSATLPAGTPFVNADIIAAARWPEEAEQHSYEAARIAEDTRAALIERREAFIAETVFSHPSKLDLIRAGQAAGYYVALHVLLVSVELSIDRVTERVRQGGHSVPAVKIRERYGRLWPLVGEAIRLSDTASVYDNARPSGPDAVARFRGGFIVGPARWPSWTPDPLVALSSP